MIGDENATTGDDDAGLARKIRRRRRWLVAYGLLAVAAVASVAAAQTLGGSKDEKKRVSALTEPSKPVIVERFKMKPASGVRGHGLAELVRKDGVSNLRVLAVRLKPSLAGESYQLVLTGGRLDPKPLGGQTVGQKGAFLGQAKITVDQLHRFTRIELRRVTDGTPPEEKLVLRAAIPG